MTTMLFNLSVQYRIQHSSGVNCSLKNKCSSNCINWWQLTWRMKCWRQHNWSVAKCRVPVVVRIVVIPPSWQHFLIFHWRYRIKHSSEFFTLWQKCATMLESVEWTVDTYSLINRLITDSPFSHCTCIFTRQANSLENQIAARKVHTNLRCGHFTEKHTDYVMVP